MRHDVLVVHGQRVFRDGLRRLLADRDDLRIVGEAADGPSAVGLAATIQPSIVLLESMLSGLDGVETVRRIVDAVRGARIIVFGHATSAGGIHRIIDAGALGYLTPAADAAELGAAIDAAIAGHVFVSSKLDHVMSSPAGARARAIHALTERQREVLKYMTEGMSTREIARTLHVSVKTVETHRKNIMDRLGIHTVAELTKYAIREGITTL